VTVLNRSMPRAEELAADFPDVEFEIKLMPDMMEVVGRSDVVFAASGSADILIDETMVGDLPACPDVVGGQRRYVDIAVPRNIGPGLNDRHDSIVYNVDDLKEVVEKNKESRMSAAREAEVLLVEEQQAFEAWRDSLETVPTIKRLRGKAETIRATELDKALTRLGESLTKKERKVLEEMSRGIVNKLLHGPMQALRSDGKDPSQVGETLDNMHALERMFDLSDEDEAAMSRKK